MVESTDKVLPIVQAESAALAATGLSALIGQVEQRSGGTNQSILKRQLFALLGVTIDDDDLISFCQKTEALEPQKVVIIAQKISAEIMEFRAICDSSFGYSDWQIVREIERNFQEFGLTFETSELFALYQSDTPEMFRLFRAKIHSNLKKMLDVISQKDEKLPMWLEDVLSAKPGAETIILAESDERETYKNLLNTMFDSHGLSNRRYLVEQVLESWTQR